MNETTTNQTPQVLPFQIFSSLLKAQNEVTNPAKNAKGYGYKYATLDTILTLVKPILAKHGLGIYQHPVGPLRTIVLQSKLSCSMSLAKVWLSRPQYR